MKKKNKNDKLKIENIAQKILNSNKSWKNQNFELVKNIEENNKINKNDDYPDTQKDMLTVLAYINKKNNSKSEYDKCENNGSFSSNIINSSKDLLDNIDQAKLNQIIPIYEELDKYFNKIKSYIDISNKDILFKCQVLAVDYIRFLFSIEIQQLIMAFNYVLEVKKFIHKQY